MPGWDMVGPVHDRPVVGDVVWAVPLPPAPVSSYVPIELEPLSPPAPVSTLTIVDLTPLVTELQQFRVMLQEALIPWYIRLWRWIRRLGR